ncbi:hypothetical protein Plhal304r1_c004g0015271 [Plasmopara halstedii]
MYTKLGGGLVTIYLQRLSDEVSDGFVNDWFAQKGTLPVYITPAHVVGGLRSRSPTPLCQNYFTGQGYSVVHHQNRAFDGVISLFLKELRDKSKPTRHSKPAPSGLNADDTAIIPPAFDNQSDTSDRSAMADNCGSDSEPHSGDHSDPDTDRHTMMDGIEAAI